jgi:hypothetical protein
MAVRDKSQSIGFVYTNIYEIYKKAQAEGTNSSAVAPSAAPSVSKDSKVLRAEDLGNIKITRFQPRTLSRAVPVPQARDSAPRQLPPSGNPFEDLKSNLNRLQDLHAKLRFMLKELEDLVGKKS